MFNQCSSLTSLDLSNFNTSNVNNMSGMFSQCSSLTSLDLSNFNTSNVKDMLNFLNINKNCLIKCKDQKIFKQYQNKYNFNI
jgi:surface protein